MITSYSNDNLSSSMPNQSYNFNNSMSNSGGTYGSSYNFGENRSKHGNYLDNALTYDPHKDKKSAFNVVYETNVYNPWGKPGGGAPKLNPNTGQLQTKIVGTLHWNLNGETDEERMARSMSNRSKTNQNLQMYKKNAFPNQPPKNIENREGTTYNYTYREPIPNLSLNPNQNAATPQNSHTPQNFSSNSQMFPHSSPPALNNNSGNAMDFGTPRLQQEAEIRSFNRSHTNASEPLRPKGFMELNRIANKLHTDNNPTTDYPNHSYWFGRAGQHKTTIGSFNPNNDIYSSDPRRRKLLDSLENRSPRDAPKIYGLDNSNLPKTQLAFVNDSHSNHRNMYENNPSNLLNY